MIDLHCDTIFRLETEKSNENLCHNSLSTSIEALEKIGARAQCFAIFTPPSPNPWQVMQSLYSRFEKEMGENALRIRQAKRGRDLLEEGLWAVLTIEDMGSVAGLNFCPEFLYTLPEGTREDEAESRICDMVAHVMHMRQVGGEDVIALGTDFDGIGGKLEIEGTEKLPLLADALLDAGLHEPTVEKFWYRNALRVLTHSQTP